MALITRVCVGMIITGIVAADLPDSELRGDDVPFILPKASGGSKADFIAQGIIARDSAMQSLENNDMADPRVAQRIKHFVDGMVELGVPLDQVLSGMLLPLQEVLRIRECDGKGPMCKDGSSSSEQLRAYLSLGKKQLAASKAAGRTPTYCETGFNAGHSAGVFLMLGFRVHSFDIAFNPYTRACAKNYEMIFPGQFVFHAGDSAKTVAAFASQEERCDVISVDGLHTYEMVVADIANFAHVAAPGNTLLVDDTSKAYMDGALQRAVDDQAKAGKAIKKGCVELVPRATMRRADVPNGWCVGSVVPTGGTHARAVATLSDAELKGDDMPFDLPDPKTTPKSLFLTMAMLARDSAVQGLNNNDMADPRMAKRMRHFVDGATAFGVHLDVVLSALLLPLQVCWLGRANARVSAPLSRPAAAVQPHARARRSCTSSHRRCCALAHSSARTESPTSVSTAS